MTIISVWTDERTEILKALFAEKMSSSLIATALNEQTGSVFSENSIVGKADRMGLKRQRVWGIQVDTSFWQSDKDQQLKALVAEQSSYARIAKILGCSRSAVAGRMKRLGLSKPAGTRLSNEERSFRIRQRHDLANKQRQEKRKLEPRVRLVRSNSNSISLRMIDVNEPARPKTMRCVGIEPRNLTLLELEPNDCRYIAGEDHLFCGHPKQAGYSFCPSHTALCWVTPLRSPTRPSFEARRAS